MRAGPVQPWSGWNRVWPLEGGESSKHTVITNHIMKCTSEIFYEKPRPWCQFLWLFPRRREARGAETPERLHSGALSPGLRWQWPTASHPWEHAVASESLKLATATTDEKRLTGNGTSRDGVFDAFSLSRHVLEFRRPKRPGLCAITRTRHLTQEQGGEKRGYCLRIRSLGVFLPILTPPPRPLFNTFEVQQADSQSKANCYLLSYVFLSREF